MDELCKAATQLINRHLDFDALISELQNAEPPTTNKTPVPSETSDSSTNVEVIYESLKLQASLSEMAISVAADQMILKKLSKISEKHNVVLLDESLVDAISACKKVSSSLNIQDLMQYKTKLQHCLPLNVLLELEENSILDIKDYLIMNVDDKSVLKEFVLSIQQLTRQNSCKVINETSLNSADIAARMLTQLIRCAYGNIHPASKALKKMCAYILINIVKSHLQYLNTLPVSKQILSDNPSIVSRICSNLSNEADVLQKCFTQMISSWVTDSPNLKVPHAVSTQHTWIASKQNEQLTLFYKEMAVCLGLEKCVTTLSDILERREVNWKNLLTFISALLVSFPESAKRLNTLISEKLKSGMETFSIELLVIAFLLARQLSLEGSHAFTTYTSWFQEKFGLNSSMISSNRAFRFFIKFLTDIVPYEPVRYLKAHIIKPPHPPASCADRLKEYSSLARIRIAELGGSLSDSIEDSEQTAKVLKDVKRVVDEYQNSNKIPRSLMEASIFQKAYFRKKFLPALMTPRPLPSIPDANMKLIEELLRIQKIPKNVYATYKEACEKENVKLLEEVMILDDDFNFEDEETSMSQQLVNVLNIIGTNKGFGKEGTDNGSVPTELLTKLNRILHSIKAENSESDEDICLYKNKKKHADLYQMAEDFMNWLGSFYEKLIDDLSIVIKLTSEHHHFTSEICHLIWKFCTSEVATASDLQLRGMTLYLNIIGCSVSVKIPLLHHSKNEILKSSLFVKSIENWQTLAASNLSSAVMFSLDCYINKKKMITVLKFVCFVIESSVILKQEFPSQFIKLFLFLGKRIEFSGVIRKDRESFDDEPLSKFAKTEELELCTVMKLHQKLSQSHTVQTSESLSVDYFLRCEIAIQTEKDILNSKERKKLYGEIFFGNDLNEKSLSLIAHVILDEFFSNENLQTVTNKEVLDYFFKSFPLLVENCETITSTGKFILDLIQTRIDRKSAAKESSDISKEIRWQSEVTTMSQFILHLPSSFLFQSFSSTKTDVDSFWNDNEKDIVMAKKKMRDVALLINEYFYNLEKSSTQFYSLSHDLTIHLVQGLVEATSFEEFIWFSMIACPCLMVSLVGYWKSDHGLKLFVKLRNKELYHVIINITESFSEETSLQQAYDILNASLRGNFVQDEEKGTSVKICLACIYLDMEDTGSCGNNSHIMMRKFSDLPTEIIGYIAFFTILKIVSHYETTSSVKSFLKTVLECCFNKLSCEYICNTLLTGRLSDKCKIFIKARNVGSFSFFALRSLLQFSIPSHLFKSRLFLPTLLHLEHESDLFLSKKETLTPTDAEPDLRKFECLSMKQAPDSAIVNSLNYLKKYPSASPISQQLHCEALKRKILL